MTVAADATIISEPVTSHEIPACLWRENSNRLVSLWDMLKRYSFSFYEVVCRLESLRASARIYESNLYPKKLYDYTREEVVACLSEMRIECVALTLGSTSGLVSHIEAEVARKGEEYTFNDLLNHLNALDASFGTELRKQFFFSIEDEKKKYFQQDELFGVKVNTAFPSCVPEIRDAGNCYALEQYEATAFHSMRVLERGLNALATKFGVDFSHTNWHNVIEEVEKKVRKMDSTFGADWKEQQKFYSQAASQFMYLKEAWRNHVMHVRDAPYDAGRTLSVFGHVRDLMQALAEGGMME